MVKKSLQSIGWDSFFNEQGCPPQSKLSFPARVIAQHNDVYHLISENGEFTGKVTGRFRYATQYLKDYPVVGDFVQVELANASHHVLIHSVLQRKNSFSRKMPISGGRKMKNGVVDGGITEEQVIASNLDVVFVMCGMDDNFNISRIERYLTLAKHQKLDVIILLNKIDLCERPEAYISQVNDIANGSLVLPISAANKMGLDRLATYMVEGKTIVFLGSSGVGKSTLLNSLLEDEVQATSQTSDYSGKGKHTTTHRQLFFHPSGCMIVDTPGMKELQLWAEDEDLDAVFADVVDLIAQCKFSNCTHRNEPDCALKPAIESGILSRERYTRYLTQWKELNRLHEKKKEYMRKYSKKSKH
ncbi:ribosome small subunit-dependent GTPase A [Paenibacillus selenitireducens]|uniref:Small ribosomal subunit biogenesis GTPase RsgA n=1 Tax=Paenibacillus selenitireducens TaxID=1324314 RepID=A0A1T2X5K1_9BACL|nr:ribosome small subunit-dependent GTPase A [Paenibacillus selenitireducens]OPA75130.1 ribosome small subunit-dependent GTPase A [Paenibacillus selenitireducens]